MLQTLFLHTFLACFAVSLLCALRSTAPIAVLLLLQSFTGFAPEWTPTAPWWTIFMLYSVSGMLLESHRWKNGFLEWLRVHGSVPLAFLSACALQLISLIHSSTSVSITSDLADPSFWLLLLAVVCSSGACVLLLRYSWMHRGFFDRLSPLSLTALTIPACTLALLLPYVSAILLIGLVLEAALRLPTHLTNNH